VNFYPGGPARLDRIAQVKVGYLAVGPGGSARACGEGETGIPGGQLITGTRAEAVHEAEVRPGGGGGLHDHRRPGGDFNNHHNEMEFALPGRSPVRAWPAVKVHVAELTAVDEPHRARLQAPSTPIRPQLARVRRIAGEQHGTGGGGRRRPGDCERCRTARRGNSVTAAGFTQDQGCDHGDQGNNCSPRNPAPGRQAGIAPWTLADLIQPSHLLRTGRHTSVSLCAVSLMPWDPAATLSTWRPPRLRGTAGRWSAGLEDQRILFVQTYAGAPWFKPALSRALNRLRAQPSNVAGSRPRTAHPRMLTAGQPG
jgi:hypothetical protein